MREQIEVVCTHSTKKGSRRGGRFSWGAFTVAEGGVARVKVRREALPPGSHVVSEGVTYAVPFMLVPPVDVEEEFAGRTRYRFRCGKCPVDVPMTEATLTHHLLRLAAEGRRVFDVSLTDK